VPEKRKKKIKKKFPQKRKIKRFHDLKGSVEGW
jgi:hypothetical protein